MSISSYSELTTAVANWMARTDLTDRIPEFIVLAEAKFNRMLFVPQMDQRATTTINTSSTYPEFITLPSDFQTMRRVRLSSVTGKPRLELMSETQLDDYRYSIDNVSAQPVYFSIVGYEMELAPTPDKNYTLEMTYRKKIPALANTSTNQTNWLLASHPDAYLYGCLLEAAPYMQDDVRIPIWAEAFKGVTDQINSLGEKRVYESAPSTISLPGVCP